LNSLTLFHQLRCSLWLLFLLQQSLLNWIGHLNCRIFWFFFCSQNHSKFGESAGGVLRFYCERIFFFKIWLSIYTSTYLRSSIERGGKRGRGGVSKIKQGGWGRGPQTSWHNETDMFWDWFRSERGEILRWSSNWKIILKNPENNFKYLFAIQFKCILTKIT